MSRAQQDLKAANERVVKKSILIVVAMFVFGYVALPMLYNLICDAFGLNGQTERVSQAQAGAVKVDTSRKVTVAFSSIVNSRLPWGFKPEVKEIELHPGELKRVNYIASNLSGSDVVGQAIYSVTPVEAARYFKKTECFCFTQQTLKSGETKEMPVLFMLEPDLPENIKTVTLSYTFFRADKYANK
jgi:cytochrome c oxidase assembly protein subunit 11